MPQGDWVALVELAQRYEAAYVEIYPPDLSICLVFGRP